MCLVADTDTENPPESESSSSTAAPSVLEDHPPTCEVVYWILRDADRPLTQQEIVERSARPQRSISSAIHRLEDETDLPAIEWSTQDSRQRHHSIR